LAASSLTQTSAEPGLGSRSNRTTGVAPTASIPPMVVVPSATWDPTVAATKYFVLEQMSAMLAIAQRLLGGTWYYDDEPFGRWMRDLQGFLPAAGTQATLEVDLGIWGAATAKADLQRRRQ
jgi:alkylation response protein AidB-like acyl-CoA dehydrogenase